MNSRLVSLASFMGLLLVLSGPRTAGAGPIGGREVLDSDTRAAFELAGRGCGTLDAPAGEIAAALAQARAIRKRFGVVGPLGGTIDVAFHNIVDGGQGLISDQIFAEQI